MRVAIRVMNAALGRLPQRDGHLQRPDREITLQAVAHRPANDTSRVQIKDHSKIKPSLTRPHVADVARPFLIRRIRMEVPVQQIRGNVERMVAVSGHLEFLGAFDTDTILAHQSTDPPMADVQAKLFQLLRHSWPAIAAQAEARLFLDMR